jgi:hypothetical protein
LPILYVLPRTSAGFRRSDRTCAGGPQSATLASNEVDPVRHLIGTASAWGLNPDKDAIYLNVTPSKNDGATTYKLNVPGDDPVDAFWSIIVYDATGHLQKNRYDAYSLNIAPPPGGGFMVISTRATR